MKIQCDVCEKNTAVVICCADEAALCPKCDTEVHAANKLASKHHRLQLDCLPAKHPFCDICQEKVAYIFCVEDRALYCQVCDESIHSASTLAANHQRYLATGIRVALNSISKCRNDTDKNRREPSIPNAPHIPVKQSVQQPMSFRSSSWSVNDLLEFPEFDSSDKMHKGKLELGEIEWWSDMNLFGDQISHETLAAAEVPQLPMSLPSNHTIYHRPIKSSLPNKKPRIEINQGDDDDDYSIVPDLG